MITKGKAKEFVYREVIKTLKSQQHRITTGMLGGAATQKDVKKVQEQMAELAEFLERKLEGRKGNQADASGQDGASETEVPAVRQP